MKAGRQTAGITCPLGNHVQEAHPVHHIEDKKDAGEQNEKHQVHSRRLHLLIARFLGRRFPVSLPLCGDYQFYN